MKFLVYIATVLILIGCATVNAPSGGPKDTIAPKPIAEKTFPANQSTNFIAKSIVIEFDEYFTLDNPSEQILISPKLEPAPEIYVQNKRLIVDFKSGLEKNTTYSINFGNSIKDLHEGNDTTLSYVFSTGNYLDSLSVSGNCKDAFTLLPIEKAWVMLYTKDSIAGKSIPKYLTRTDKNGNYKINNIKNDIYNIVALVDANQNFKYDLITEQVGFINQEIDLKDSSKNKVDLKLFTEQDTSFQIESYKLNENGLIEIICNKNFKSNVLFSEGSTVWYNHFNDTIFAYINPTYVKDEFRIVVNFPEINFNDTLNFYNTEIIKEKTKVKYSTQIHPENKIKITPNYPLQKLDAAKIKVYIDSTEVNKTIEIDSNNLSFNLNLDAKEKDLIDILILPDAITSIYETNNKDTLYLKSTVKKRSDFASILVSSNEPKGIIQLLDRSNKVIREANSNKKITFEKLLPGSYQLRLIIDSNENNTWDSGNFNSKQQAEKIIYYSEKINLKANWDIEIDWVVE